MIRRPPRSTPFPTRRSSDLWLACWCCCRARSIPTCARRSTDRRSGRSEEHTSELQSQSNLVCRLLLEKKKDNPDYTSELLVCGSGDVTIRHPDTPDRSCVRL